MRYSVQASITPVASAKLLLSGEIDLANDLSYQTAQSIFDALLSLPFEDVLSIVDMHRYGVIADVKCIPQFGKLDTVIKVPQSFSNTGCSCLDYPQLGLYLKKDPSASLEANTKFGENHGKAASILGITQCVDKRIVPSGLTNAFNHLTEAQQLDLATRLLFRIPIIQIILKEASKGQYNGYESMLHLKQSTMCRRGQCLRQIFKLFKDYSHIELNRRINNIVWTE